ncbi:MAG: hypothetical protein DHS20C21_00120 [Gemmatimonadota bacterium]|nr:MAG: hypothetical protein DHS20C21_00120 [Gemmatimonadota bacterium]
MSITPHHVLGAIAIGVGASVLMDAWNLFLKRACGVRSLDYCLLGRWLLHMPEGTFLHSSIAVAPPRRGECAAGWVAHYTIGVGLATVFLALAPADWLERPTLPHALLFGIVTVVFPLFILQPSLGLGVASSKTPRPMQARRKSFVTHMVFGVGLYLCALALNHLPFAA